VAKKPADLDASPLQHIPLPDDPEELINVLEAELFPNEPTAAV